MAATTTAADAREMVRVAADDDGNCYNTPMGTAKETLDRYFGEMRWRCLSLAADLDRVERAPGGNELLSQDPRLKQLRQAIEVLFTESGTRAEQVQMIFSDLTPPPKR